MCQGPNKFEYERTQNLFDNYFKWKITLESGKVIKGTANSVRQAYRLAKRAYKRHLKMERLLNDGSSR